MGWTVFDGPLGCTPDDYLRRQYTYERNGMRVTTLATGWRGTVCYMAVRLQYAPGAEPGPCERSAPYRTPRDYVCALVVLTCGSQARGWGYKTMDEEAGPRETRCPANVLRLLTPLVPGRAQWAHEWRRACRGASADQPELAL